MNLPSKLTFRKVNQETKEFDRLMGAKRGRDSLMPFETTFLDTKRRDSDDVIDYFFRVWDGTTLCDVAVGITGQAINPVGKPPRTGEVLIPLADAWLNHHLDRGFDPFTQSAPRIPDVTASIADYWCDHRELPPSL